MIVDHFDSREMMILSTTFRLLILLTRDTIIFHKDTIEE